MVSTQDFESCDPSSNIGGTTHLSCIRWNHTCIVHTVEPHIYRVYRGKKERQNSDTERPPQNSTAATLVLLQARSTAPIHGTDSLRPDPTDEARKIVSLLKDTPHLA